MKYLIGLTLVLLAGCTPSAKEILPAALPDGLKDCKFYELTDSNGVVMRVVRCPLASTSLNYKSGKSTRQSVVIDGTEYVQK